MSVSHIHTRTVTGPAGAPYSLSTTVSGSAEVNVNETIPGAATDLQLTCPIDVSSLKSLMIKCDRAIQIETNSGSAPDDVIHVAANNMISWDSLNGQDCPLTVDVTSIFVTLASGASATLVICTVQDATP